MYDALVLFHSIALAAALIAQEPFDSDDPFDADFRTGIEVGARIPELKVEDLNGSTWDFDRIKGPKGALLHFYRSADW
jgi:hypothetical protein